MITKSKEANKAENDWLSSLILPVKQEEGRRNQGLRMSHIMFKGFTFLRLLGQLPHKLLI